MVVGSHVRAHAADVAEGEDGTSQCSACPLLAHQIHLKASPNSSHRVSKTLYATPHATRHRYEIGTIMRRTSHQLHAAGGDVTVKVDEVDGLGQFVQVSLKNLQFVLCMHARVHMGFGQRALSA